MAMMARKMMTPRTLPVSRCVAQALSLADRTLTDVRLDGSVQLRSEPSKVVLDEILYGFIMAKLRYRSPCISTTIHMPPNPASATAWPCIQRTHHRVTGTAPAVKRTNLETARQRGAVTAREA